MNSDRSLLVHPARRRIVVDGFTADAALGLPRLAGAQGRKALKISIDRIPWAAGNSPMSLMLHDPNS